MDWELHIYTHNNYSQLREVRKCVCTLHTTKEGSESALQRSVWLGFWVKVTTGFRLRSGWGSGECIMSLTVLKEIKVHRCCTNLLHTCAINYESPPGDVHSLLTNLYKFLTNPAPFSPQRVLKTRVGSDHSESGSLGLRLTKLQLMSSDATQRTEC